MLESQSSVLRYKINIGRRELKETLLSNLKILCIPITFGMSEKRLLGYILDEMRSDTPPR
ncbi:hypothetical protein T01_10307 [Trichinella spiralis]|uniref:Uncharacterized protein n=1 Tax=Trichinella spiralis TaxID=6334 RepID=A0A0V0YC94_TRISP|nr:hypothetical protein T01_10307 [Trichinella spiralis]